MKNVHEIEIELKGKEWEDILDETFKKKIKDVRIDGFRKGSVPKDVYLKKFGIESLYMDSVDEAYRIGYTQILEKHKLIPVCAPKVEIKHIRRYFISDGMVERFCNEFFCRRVFKKFIVTQSAFKSKKY